MLDPELKKKWVAALRSGEFKQGRESLVWPDEGTYCCLGVLCKLLKPGFEPLSLNGAGYGHLGSNGLPKDIENDLITKNDCARWSFAEIADYIEGNDRI